MATKARYRFGFHSSADSGYCPRRFVFLLRLDLSTLSGLIYWVAVLLPDASGVIHFQALRAWLGVHVLPILTLHFIFKNYFRRR